MEKITFHSPIIFRWESLGENVDYEYHITRMNCLDNYNSAGTVIDGTVTLPEITVDLPPNLNDECYGFHLYALQDDGHIGIGSRIGMLMTHGENGYGWDYRFRVQ